MRGLTSVAKAVEDVVVALTLERHPHDAGGRGGEQERTERAVDRAVGDVEQLRPGPTARRDRRAAAPSCPRPARGRADISSSIVSRPCTVMAALPCRRRRRRLAMPSAALRRAAASLLSSITATSA